MVNMVKYITDIILWDVNDLYILHGTIKSWAHLHVLLCTHGWVGGGRGGLVVVVCGIVWGVAPLVCFPPFVTSSTSLIVGRGGDFFPSPTIIFLLSPWSTIVFLLMWGPKALATSARFMRAARSIFFWDIFFCLPQHLRQFLHLNAIMPITSSTVMSTRPGSVPPKFTASKLSLLVSLVVVNVQSLDHAWP